ncbi:urea transporter 2 [Microplitis demolitor]|uniref:urea transporter 2 n=1 Tax=Microplitis demolitor TaxID=69319 RepID=UPI00235B66B4|nr:urea transporter 2 [Microplitis demolitor]
MEEKNTTVVCMGDFFLLREKIVKNKNNSIFWFTFGIIDSLLRGIGQVIFANNPLSGLLILLALLFSSPLVICTGLLTGFLGLTVSMLIQEPLQNIENGLTVYNPVLVGCITYSLFSNNYNNGNWDSFSVLLTFIATILSVYLTRSLTTDNFPCVTLPFNLIEIILFIILMIQGNDSKINLIETNNIANMTDNFINQNAKSNENSTNLDWGMVFRGMVVASSQAYGVDNVPAGSIIYLAVVIYSPVTAVFSFTGAAFGALIALGLGIPYKEIYSGLWGYNSFLTGAAFGGLFITFNQQTIPLTIASISFTVAVQYILQHTFSQFNIPIFTIPFVITFFIFLGVRKSNGFFIKPETVTFPEEQRQRYLNSQVHGSSPVQSISD